MVDKLSNRLSKFVQTFVFVQMLEVQCCQVYGLIFCGEDNKMQLTADIINEIIFGHPVTNSDSSTDLVQKTCLTVI